MVAFDSLLIGLAMMFPGQADPGAAAPSDAAQLIEQLDSTIERPYFFSRSQKPGQYEAQLLKIISIGASAEKPLQEKLRREVTERTAAESELNSLGPEARFPRTKNSARLETRIDLLSNNLELLTALRRIQKRTDPLQIDVTLPKEVKSVTGRLPTVSVKLNSVDVEKTDVWVQLVPHYHGSHRQAQWRFEVRTAEGKLLPAIPNPDLFRHLGGIKSDGWLRFGESLKTDLPMGDFVSIPEPGDYEVTLAYHSKLPIADESAAAIEQMIIFRSKPFRLHVDKGPRITIETSKSIRDQVARHASDLPREGVVRIVGGVYDEDDFAFVPPDSPAGRILSLHWQAVPSLIDLLSEQSLTRHQKAWILGLLFTITAQRDLTPIWAKGALPSFDGESGPNTLGADPSGERKITEEGQERLFAGWRRFRDESLEIIER